MNRREFIKRSVPVTAIPFLINGLPIRAYGRSSFLETLVGAQSATDRVLVLVQLGGGNDGINTVIPLDQLSAYNNLRGNIAIPETSALQLTAATGLHPAMTGMKNLYDAGKLAVVQGVSYPNPNLSHFRATDIWLSASDSNVEINTGWLGRYLDYEFPLYPDDPVMPDPLAIQISSIASLSLQGPERSMGIAIQSPDTFYQLVTAGTGTVVDTPPSTPAGKELDFIRTISIQSQAYALQIKAAADKVLTQVTYPTNNSLADQLKVVARMIAGGLKTRIYVVNLGGFDNHSAQVVSGSTTTGVHATLLQRLSDAVKAFQDDLRQLNVDQRVLGMTFSEFGRRVQSNASLGTDHGTAAPMFLFGVPVQAGIVGNNPSLSVLSSGNLTMQYDFRSVYASILSQWFGVSTLELNAVLFKNFQSMPLIRSSFITDVDQVSDLPTEYRLYSNYPNPFNPSTTIAYDLPSEANVALRVYDIMGREVSTIVNDYQPAGHHQVQFNANGLATGAYIYQLQAGSYTDRKRMMLVK